jgi:hypothetical protein
MAAPLEESRPMELTDKATRLSDRESGANPEQYPLL